MTLQQESCDRELWTHGEVVCTFHARAKVAEDWVRMVAAFSGARVDWGYACGHCVVRCFGRDRRVVERTVQNCRPFLNAEGFQFAQRETAWTRFAYRVGRSVSRLWRLARG